MYILLSPWGEQRLFPLLQGRELANKACSHQAYGRQYSKARKAASWPTRPVCTRRMVDNTLRRVSQTAREAGSSWSCVASNGSTEWNNPRGAVLTGVDVPTAPPPARGGGMM